MLLIFKPMQKCWVTNNAVLFYYSMIHPDILYLMFKYINAEHIYHSWIPNDELSNLGLSLFTLCNNNTFPCV